MENKSNKIQKKVLGTQWREKILKDTARVWHKPNWNSGRPMRRKKCPKNCLKKEFWVPLGQFFFPECQNHSGAKWRKENLTILQATRTKYYGLEAKAVWTAMTPQKWRWIYPQHCVQPRHQMDDTVGCKKRQKKGKHSETQISLDPLARRGEIDIGGLEEKLRRNCGVALGFSTLLIDGTWK